MRVEDKEEKRRMGQTESAIRLHIVHGRREGQRLLDEAEKKDFYVEECREDPMNRRARSTGVYQARDMTPQENAFFEVVTENAREKIPLRLRSELSDVFLVSLTHEADGGMPHTRPSAVICYPDITKTFSVNTLLHELWHVHQRQHEAWWKNVFHRMGWQPWSGELPLRLENHRRYNPDTLDSPLWCYQQTWVPIPIFRDVAHPKVGEVDVWFYHVSLKYHVKSPPKEMAAMYYSLPFSAYEHPREMAAYLLSDPVSYSACPALTLLLEQVGAISLPTE